MGLPKIIQIPCNHVLSNQNALKFTKGSPLKPFFNINLGIGIIKKNYFFCLYFLHISLCFYSNFNRESSLDSTSNEYPHCILLMDPATPKLEIPKKTWWWHHRHVFSSIVFFGVAGSIKSMSSGYSLDAKFNSASNELSQSKFE